MKQSHYIKLPKSFSEQVALLQKRGLHVDNKTRAERILTSISYNRLSNYWEPFLAEPKEEEIFLPGTDFDMIFKRYQFDSELRAIVFQAIEQIEVGLRTQLIYHLSHQFKSGYGIYKPDLYNSVTLYHKAMVRIQKAVSDSKLPFVTKFNKKYSNEQLPAWKSLELISFRTLFNLYRNLKKSPQKMAINKYFSVHHTVFESWIDTLVYLRNICAHHARFWNIVLTITPKWPKSMYDPWVDRWENEKNTINPKDPRLKTYAGLCIILFLLDRVNPHNKFRRNFSLSSKSFP